MKDKRTRERGKRKSKERRSEKEKRGMKRQNRGGAGKK